MFSKSKGHVFLCNTRGKASTNDNKLVLFFQSALNNIEY